MRCEQALLHMSTTTIERSPTFEGYHQTMDFMGIYEALSRSHVEVMPLEPIVANEAL